MISPWVCYGTCAPQHLYQWLWQWDEVHTQQVCRLPGVVQLAWQMEGMTSKGTWTKLRSGHMWIKWVSTMPSAKCWTGVRTIPNIHTDWEKNLTAALQRRTWGFWWMKSGIWASCVLLQPRRPTASWAASKE